MSIVASVLPVAVWPWQAAECRVVTLLPLPPAGVGRGMERKRQKAHELG